MRDAESVKNRPSNSHLAQVALLPSMPLPQLRKLWRDLYQSDPPDFNRVYLVSRLAYRLQELAYGGDDEMLVRRMAEMAKARLDKNGVDKKPHTHRPPIGTKLIREHKGIEYQVVVLADGFAFNGRKYRSLSRIAQLITGSLWSGPLFFGLTRRGKEAEK